MTAPHTNSYYAASAIGMVDYPQLAGTESCDVCVVGGGYTGISTALNLAEKGYDVILLEANRIGWGASGRNGGQLGSGLNWSQQELEKEFGNETAHAFWNFCELAKEEVKGRIKKHDIPCDFKSGVLAAACNRKADRSYRQEVDHLHEHYHHQSVQYLSGDEVFRLLMTKQYFGGKLDKSAGHLHPLNLAIGLARAASEAKARVYENSAVTSYARTGDGYTIATGSGGSVTSKIVVFGCNAYIGNVSRNFSKFVMPFTSCIAATEPLGEAISNEINRDDIAVHDSRFCLDYYRLSADRRLVWGGAERYIPSESGNIERLIRRRILKVYPSLGDFDIEYAWGGQIAITRSRLPSVGRVEGDVYYAQGFSGHGIALTNIVGKLLAEMISGTAEGYDLFASIPHKPFPGGQLLRWPAHVLTMLTLSTIDGLNNLIWGSKE